MDLSTQATTGGPDSLTLFLSEDAWRGDARFTVAVDGQQVGGVFTAATLRGAGTDSLTLNGDWGGGGHDLAITFLNDRWGGTAATDRNLYLEGVSYNGNDTPGATAALYSNGTAHVGFAGEAAARADAPAYAAPVYAGGTAVAAQGDLPATHLVWLEDFNNGPGMLSRTWGHVDGSVAGQITLTSYAWENWQTDSGAMVPPTGAWAGYGYGVYSFTLSMSGGAPGPYALLWPATDVWPGPELDVVEQTAGGNAYSTVHWKGADGRDAFQSYGMGVDTTQIHTYAIDWQRDHIDYFVDGRLTAHVTDHVPRSAADGGENSAPGVGMQTWWSAGIQHGDNVLTVYQVSYATMA